MATNSSITISPRAIFEIVKDIQVGRNGSESKGFLYGLPDDPIEVTSAFPEYSPKAEPPDNADPAIKEDYNNSVQSFQKAHLEELKKHNCDSEHIGFYTSRHVGGRLHMSDLYRQFQAQLNYPLIFTLVVTFNGSSLSTRAFRVSDSTEAFMKENNIDQIGHIDEKVFFDNFVKELKVNFKMEELDKALIQEMLGRFNLISDVFRLRDMSTLQDQMLNIYESLDNIATEVNKAVQDQVKIKENRRRREQWIRERNEKNALRKQRKQELLSLDDVDEQIEKVKQESKRKAIDYIYDFRARAEATADELDDEKVKIQTLQTLSQNN